MLKSNRVDCDNTKDDTVRQTRPVSQEIDIFHK